MVLSPRRALPPVDAGSLAAFAQRAEEELSLRSTEPWQGFAQAMAELQPTYRPPVKDDGWRWARKVGRESQELVRTAQAEAEKLRAELALDRAKLRKAEDALAALRVESAQQLRVNALQSRTMAVQQKALHAAREEVVAARARRLEEDLMRRVYNHLRDAAGATRKTRFLKARSEALANQLLVKNNTCLTRAMYNRLRCMPGLLPRIPTAVHVSVSGSSMGAAAAAAAGPPKKKPSTPVEEMNAMLRSMRKVQRATPAKVSLDDLTVAREHGRAAAHRTATPTSPARTYQSRGGGAGAARRRDAPTVRSQRGIALLLEQRCVFAIFRATFQRLYIHACRRQRRRQEQPATRAPSAAHSASTAPGPASTATRGPEMGTADGGFTQSGTGTRPRTGTITPQELKPAMVLEVTAPAPSRGHGLPPPTYSKKRRTMPALALATDHAPSPTPQTSCVVPGGAVAEVAAMRTMSSTSGGDTPLDGPQVPQVPHTTPVVRAGSGGFERMLSDDDLPGRGRRGSADPVMQQPAPTVQEAPRPVSPVSVTTDPQHGATPGEHSLDALLPLPLETDAVHPVAGRTPTPPTPKRERNSNYFAHDYTADALVLGEGDFMAGLRSMREAWAPPPASAEDPVGPPPDRQPSGLCRVFFSSFQVPADATEDGDVVLPIDAAGGAPGDADATSSDGPAAPPTATPVDPCDASGSGDGVPELSGPLPSAATSLAKNPPVSTVSEMELGYPASGIAAPPVSPYETVANRPCTQASFPWSHPSRDRSAMPKPGEAAGAAAGHGAAGTAQGGPRRGSLGSEGWWWADEKSALQPFPSLMNPPADKEAAGVDGATPPPAVEGVGELEDTMPAPAAEHERQEEDGGPLRALSYGLPDKETMTMVPRRRASGKDKGKPSAKQPLVPAIAPVSPARVVDPPSPSPSPPPYESSSSSSSSSPSSSGGDAEASPAVLAHRILAGGSPSTAVNSRFSPEPGPPIMRATLRRDTWAQPTILNPTARRLWAASRRQTAPAMQYRSVALPDETGAPPPRRERQATAPCEPSDVGVVGEDVAATPVGKGANKQTPDVVNHNGSSTAAAGQMTTTTPAKSEEGGFIPHTPGDVSATPARPPSASPLSPESASLVVAPERAAGTAPTDAGVGEAGTASNEAGDAAGQGNNGHDDAPRTPPASAWKPAVHADTSGVTILPYSPTFSPARARTPGGGGGGADASPSKTDFDTCPMTAMRTPRRDQATATTDTRTAGAGVQTEAAAGILATPPPPSEAAVARAAYRVSHTSSPIEDCCRDTLTLPSDDGATASPVQTVLRVTSEPELRPAPASSFLELRKENRQAGGSVGEPLDFEAILSDTITFAPTATRESMERSVSMTSGPSLTTSSMPGWDDLPEDAPYVILESIALKEQQRETLTAAMITKMQDMLHTQHRQLTKQHSDLSTLSGSVKELTTQLQERETEAQAQQATLADRDRAIEQLEQQVHFNSDLVSDRSVVLHTLRDDLAAARGQMELLERDLQRKEAAMNEQQGTILMQGGELAEKDKLMQALAKEMQPLQMLADERAAIIAKQNTAIKRTSRVRAQAARCLANQTALSALAGGFTRLFAYAAAARRARDAARHAAEQAESGLRVASLVDEVEQAHEARVAVEQREAVERAGYVADRAKWATAEAALRDDMAALTADYKHLEAEHAPCNEEKALLAAQCAKVQASFESETARMAADLKEAKARGEKLAVELRTAEATVEDLEKDVASATSELASTKALLDTETRAHRDARDTVTLLQEQLEEANGAMEAAAKTIAEKDAAMAAHNEEHKAEAERMRTAHAAELAVCSGERDVLASSLVEAREAHAAEAEEQREAHATETKLQEDIHAAALESVRAAHESAMAEVREKHATAVTEAEKAHATEVKTMNDVHRAAMETAAAAHTAELAEKTEEMEAAAAAAAAKSDALAAELCSEAEQRERWESAASALTEEKSELAASAAVLETRAAALAAQHELLEARVDELLADRDATRDALAATGDALGNARTEAAACEARCAALEADLREAEAKVIKAETNADNLRRKLADAVLDPDQPISFQDPTTGNRITLCVADTGGMRYTVNGQARPTIKTLDVNATAVLTFPGVHPKKGITVPPEDAPLLLPALREMVLKAQSLTHNLQTHSELTQMRLDQEYEWEYASVRRSRHRSRSGGRTRSPSPVPSSQAVTPGYRGGDPHPSDPHTTRRKIFPATPSSRTGSPSPGHAYEPRSRLGGVYRSGQIPRQPWKPAPYRSSPSRSR